MRGVCPLCNNLVQVSRRCACGARMQDAGPVNDYFGPYSPYFNAGFPVSCCVHLFTCPVCGRDKRVGVSF